MDLSGIYSAVRAHELPATPWGRPGPYASPFRARLAQPFPVRFDRSFIRFCRARGTDGIMAAAHSLSPLLLPLAPSPVQSPLLFFKSAAFRRARDAGGGRGGATGALRLTTLRPAAAVAGEVDSPMDMEQAEAVMRVAADDDSVTATVVSVLLTLAFVGLSLLTIGVIYLSVQDFLQKREREKFEKEEAERQKEEARKKRAKARGRKRNW